jgi:hypothetical protein
MRFEKSHALACMMSLLLVAPALADETSAGTPIEKLGDERYRIGAITIDRNTASFTVPGKILHLTDALEYLAVSIEGMKEYESLLELSTSPADFNLACILLGLDDKNSVKPRYQFDERKADGQAVAISLSWEKDGETVTISGENALANGSEMFDDNGWVYIGSTTGNYGKEFMADVGGTLIGFVHDPYSIIDHRNGAGIGNYGLITGNEDVLPAVGTAISLTVSVLQE